MKTQNINRILIPLDFSETGLLALDHAAFMARLFKADLYLLHVVEIIELAYNVYGPILLDSPFLKIRDNEEIEKIASEKLNKLAKKISKRNGITVIPLISFDRVISGITEVAKDNNIDIIVMGTHGAKGFNEYFIGSNSHKAVTVSPCPVVTVQTHAKKLGFKNIVMPIDNALHSRQKVDLTIELAAKYGAKIHILGLNNPKDVNEKNKFSIKIDSVEKAVKHSKLKYVRKIVKGKNLAITAMNYSKKMNNPAAELRSIA